MNNPPGKLGWIIICGRTFWNILILLLPLQAKPEGIMALWLYGQVRKEEEANVRGNQIYRT